MLNLKPLPHFRRDYRRCEHRHMNINELNQVVGLIQSGGNEEILINKYDDHQLSGNQWRRARDLHVVGGRRGDWLLIYKVFKASNVLVLVRTGTHKELFGD